MQDILRDKKHLFYNTVNSSIFLVQIRLDRTISVCIGWIGSVRYYRKILDPTYGNFFSKKKYSPMHVIMFNFFNVFKFNSEKKDAILK